jgi:hypothetical protein
VIPSLLSKNTNLEKPPTPAVPPYKVTIGNIML